MAKLKKRYYFIGFLILIFGVILFYLSDITKYYLIKNSEKLTGRKIEIGELHFNYARVAVTVRNFILYEPDKTDSFISFRELYIDFNPWALISHEYSVSGIRLKQPQIHVVQDGEKFNFDSLIPKSDTTRHKKTEKNQAVRFTIRNIQLDNGQITYTDVQNRNELVLKKLDLNLPLIAWNSEQSDMGVDFSIGEKGKVSCKATVNNKGNNYRILLKAQDVEIQPVTSYLTGYFDVASMNGLLTTEMNITGDLNEVVNVKVDGEAKVTGFSMLDRHAEKIVASPEVDAVIKDINLKTFHFGFGKIEVHSPELMVVRGKDMTNIERFFLPYFHEDSLAKASGVQNNETPVTYSIDTIRVNDGMIVVSDKTLNRPFRYVLDRLDMTMTGLTESADKIPVTFSTRLNNLGELSGSAVWSMADLMNLKIGAKLKNLNLVSFSPYTEYYIASPITQGTFNYEVSLKMTQQLLDNQNKVKVEGLEFGKRTRDTTAVKVPVRLALYLMKDINDEIRFDLPVSGNPSDPKFKLGRIIWKTFVNLVVKTAASPFTALSRLTGNDPDAFKKLSFDFAQDSLDNAQREILNKISIILKKKPDLAMTFTQTTDPVKEKEKLAIQWVKSEYLASVKTDSVKLLAGGLKDEDAGLLAFIRKSAPGVDSCGIGKTCMKMAGQEKIAARFQSLLEGRNKLVTDYLLQQGLPVETVHVHTADLVNLPEELRVPQFKIEVSLK